MGRSTPAPTSLPVVRSAYSQQRKRVPARSPSLYSIITSNLRLCFLAANSMGCENHTPAIGSCGLKIGACRYILARINEDRVLGLRRPERQWPL